MADKYDLQNWLIEALLFHGKSARIVDVCKYVWEKYEQELRASGDLFYTWQYDIRWAATELRKRRRMKAAHISPRGLWELI